MSNPFGGLKALTAIAILILAAGCASQSPTGPAPTDPNDSAYAFGGG